MQRVKHILIAAFVCTLASSPLSPGRADPLEGATPAAREGCAAATFSRKPVWKTVTVGTFKDYFALRNALDEADISVGVSADEILARPSFDTSRVRKNHELVVYSASDLGFKDERVTQAQIYQRARCAGLQLSDTEIAPILRLAYRDQPLNEVLIVAMEPRKTYDGELVVLSLAHFAAGSRRRGLMLLGGDGRLDTKIPAAMPFVFVRSAPEVAERR